MWISFKTDRCPGSYIFATSSSPLSMAKVYIVKSFVPIAKKSQFLANSSEINAAAGVSINTPILGVVIFNLLFFFNKSLFTSVIIFFVSINSDTFETIGNIIFIFPYELALRIAVICLLKILERLMSVL